MSGQAEALRKARQEAGLPLDEAARRFHVSRAALSNYERRIRRVPEDIQARAPEVYRNPMLRLWACEQCKVGFFQLPVLDRVDLHPVVVRDKLVEELEEAIAALRPLRLINKREPADFSEAERGQVLAAMAQTWDTFDTGALDLVALSQLLGIDLTTIADQHRRKVFERGYWSAGSGGKKESAQRR